MRTIWGRVGGHKYRWDKVRRHATVQDEVQHVREGLYPTSQQPGEERTHPHPLPRPRTSPSEHLISLYPNPNPSVPSSNLQAVRVCHAGREGPEVGATHENETGRGRMQSSTTDGHGAGESCES
jgi:hypothetical protein